METDYISRDEILEKQKTLHEMQYGTGSRTLVDVPAVRVSDIESIPAADVRPVKRGERVAYPECMNYINAYAADHIVCSACKECFSIMDNDCERFNFCPNCGADMTGGADG